MASVTKSVRALSPYPPHPAVAITSTSAPDPFPEWGIALIIVGVIFIGLVVILFVMIYLRRKTQREAAQKRAATVNQGGIYGAGYIPPPAPAPQQFIPPPGSGTYPSSGYSPQGYDPYGQGVPMQPIPIQQIQPVPMQPMTRLGQV
jgi:hypothetical protein